MLRGKETSNMLKVNTEFLSNRCKVTTACYHGLLWLFHYKNLGYPRGTFLCIPHTTIL